MKTEHYRPKNT